MATPLEVLRASKSQTTGITNGTTTKTPLEVYRETHPVEKSTLGKVASFLAPTVTKTVEKYKKGEDITTRDVIGSALEVGSYLIPTGVVAKGVSLGIKGAGLASKVAIGATTGALSGAAFNAGGTVAEGGSLSDVAKSSLIGAGIGGVAGGTISGIAGKYTANKLAKSKLATIAENAVVKETTPVVEKAVTPKITLKQELPNTKKVNLTKDLQKPETLIKNQPVTPQESVAMAKAKKEGVPYVKPVEAPVIPVKAPVIVTPEIPIVPSIPEQSIAPREGFQSSSFPERKAKFSQMDAQHIEDVVFNDVPTEGGMSREMYIAELYDRAKVNPSLAERLATSGIVTEDVSKAGQNLGAFSQGQGTIIDIIKDAHTALKSALPGYITSGEKKAVESIQKDIKTALSKFNNASLSIEERLSALDILKCK